jgi:RNA polymerase sigma-70 factor (ECF subfamily)
MPEGHEGTEWFDRLLQTFGAALARLAAAYARDWAERDEVLQEMLVALWQAFPRFRGDCAERTFVFRVAHNRGITFASRRRWDARLDAATEDVPDPRADQDEATVRAIEHDRLLAAVRELPEIQREAVLLHLEGLSHREIGEIQGTSENYVAVRLSRARQSLRARLRTEEDVRR